MTLSMRRKSQRGMMVSWVMIPQMEMGCVCMCVSYSAPCSTHVVLKVRREHSGVTCMWFLCVSPHPLDPRGETVLNDDAAAVLVPGQTLPAARHRHRAPRLVPRVRAVKGVADRTRGLHPEDLVDATSAERVTTRERLLLLNLVQTNDAVLRTLLLRVSAVFHLLFLPSVTPRAPRAASACACKQLVRSRVTSAKY